MRDLLFVGAVLLHRPDLDGAAALARAVGDPPAVGQVGGAGVEARVGREPAQVLPVRAHRVDVDVAADVDAEGDPPVRRPRVGGARGANHGGQSGHREHGGESRCDYGPLHLVPSSCCRWVDGLPDASLTRQATFTCGCSVAIVNRPSLSSAVTRALLGGSRSRSSYSRGGSSGPASAGSLTVA